MTAPSTGHKLLVVDDDDVFRDVLARELRRRGNEVVTAATGEEALASARAPDIDVVLLDLRLPDLDGIEVLQRIQAGEASVGVLMLTGHGTIDTAIRAIRLGAYDYLEKPCPIEKVEMSVRKVREHMGLLARQQVLRDGYSVPDVRGELVGQSGAALRLKDSLLRIARTDATTLLLGETGVGKDLAARMLHAESARRDAPFVVVDCASLHEDLLQSELFGHEKGSFSGAERRKHGLFEVAHGGSIFLDEVGEMSLEIQAALLRVLESGTFRRVGGTKEVSVDVRVISATNRDLKRAVARGRFRQDLFYRLSTCTVEIPPLRERREDIPLLIDHFIARSNRRFRRECRLDEDARKVLEAHDWPGNVRELVHVLEQATVMADGDVIRREHLVIQRPPARTEEPEEGWPTLKDLQYRHVRAVLDHVRGNRAQAARILGISERNVYRWIKRLGGDPERD
ncbi:MAG: sigma-54 dependent transcriptional regulator [Planctomycetota bacterium]